MNIARSGAAEVIPNRSQRNRRHRAENGSAWEILARTQVSEIDGVRVRVATVSDLLLLKLYAGGPQDAWDIEQLLEIAADRGALAARVEAELAALPTECRRLWSRIRPG